MSESYVNLCYLLMVVPTSDECCVLSRILFSYSTGTRDQVGEECYSTNFFVLLGIVTLAPIFKLITGTVDLIHYAIKSA